MRASRVLALTCVLACLAAILAGVAGAEVPRKINYQGRLTDTDTGEPIAGPLIMTFRIFDVEEGGSAAWTETQAVTPDSAGVISAILGSITPIDAGFDGPMWLEVEVGGEVLSPRREMVSVPYAFHAMNTDSLGGVLADSFSVQGHIHDDRYFTEAELGDAGTVNDGGNPVDWTKLKNVPAGFADGTDEGGGAGDGHSLDAADGDPVNVVFVDNNGNVGVGTAIPERRLHVYDGYAGSVTSSASAEIVVEDDDDARINLISPGDQTVGIEFGDQVDPTSGWLIYNNTDDRMKLGVNNDDRIVVDNSGEVGIGTSGPAAQLHLYKNTNGLAELRIENPNTGSSSAERLSFNNEDGGVAYIAAYDEGHSTLSGSMVIANNRPGGNLRFHTGGVERLSISDFGATYVTAPGGSPLQCQTSGAGYIEIETDTVSPTGLRMANSNREWYLLHSPAGDDRIALFDANGTGERERLVITGGTGYVGIHKTNPIRELDISGRLRNWHDTAGMEWTGEFYNTDSAGHGLMAVGNGGPYWYVTGGTGINSSGYDVGGYFRAVNTSSTGGQKALFTQNGAGGYAYICYRSSSGFQYDVWGNGDVALVMPTSKGDKILTSSHSPEAWIEDYGNAEIKDGFCHVDLDQLFADCVTIDEANPVKVFVQMTSPVTNQYYVDKGGTGFDVIVVGDGAQDVNATFDYRVVAARRNREKVRFAEAESPEQVQAQAVRVTPEQMGEE
jgi:hypothetical protein